MKTKEEYEKTYKYRGTPPEEWNKLPLDEKIYNTIHSKQKVSFVELQRAIPEMKGDIDWLYSGKANILLWVNVTERFVDTMTKMLANKIIFACPSIEYGHLVYLHDGGILGYPIVNIKEMIKKPFKHFRETHWLPVVFDTVPSKENLYFGENNN